MSSFEFEVVSDNSARVRGQCSLFLDPAGMPHVAYAAGSGHIVVASRNGVAGAPWQRESVFGVEVRSDEDERVELQLDSGGQPQLACIESGSARLLHGVRGADGRWALTPVASNLTMNEPGSVLHVCFVLHPGLSDGAMRDAPQFLFEDLHSNSLGYARLLDGAMTLSRAAAAIDLGDAGSSETGRCGAATIEAFSKTLSLSYVEEFPSRRRVHVARIVDFAAGQAVGIRSIDEGSSFIGRTSLFALGSEVWVAYADVTKGQLKAATFNSDGQPVVEVVDTLLSRTLPSLAHNAALAGGGSAEKLRIAYADDGKLKLARRTRFDGWQLELVEAAAATHPALAYDGHGTGHLVYAAGGAIRYARITE